MVKAQGNNKNISVKATSVYASPNVNAKPVVNNLSVNGVNDLSKYYSELSKDYSGLSKDYAEQSKQYSEEVVGLLDTKQDKLIAGNNITIENNIISAEGGGGDLSEYAKIEDVNTALSKKANIEDLVYDWIGTKAEYEISYANGTIQNDWMCYITDDEKDFLAEYIPTFQIITQADYEALPVKDSNILYLIEE